MPLVVMTSLLRMSKCNLLFSLVVVVVLTVRARYPGLLGIASVVLTVDFATVTAAENLVLITQDLMTDGAAWIMDGRSGVNEDRG